MSKKNYNTSKIINSQLTVALKYIKIKNNINICNSQCFCLFPVNFKFPVNSLYQFYIIVTGQLLNNTH